MLMLIIIVNDSVGNMFNLLIVNRFCVVGLMVC